MSYHCPKCDEWYDGAVNHVCSRKNTLSCIGCHKTFENKERFLHHQRSNKFCPAHKNE